ELCGIFRFGRATKAGADRVDKDQVGLVEPGRLIVFQFALDIRRPGRITARDPLWSECRKMEERRISARPAIPQKHEWPRLIRRRPVKQVSDKEHVAMNFTGLVVSYGQVPGVSRVFQRSLAELDLVRRRDDLVVDRLGGRRGSGECRQDDAASKDGF